MREFNSSMLSDKFLFGDCYNTGIFLDKEKN